MGDGFDLSGADEWRTIYATLRRQRFPKNDMLFEWAGEPVSAILSRLFQQYPGRFLLDISLLRRKH